MLSRGRSQTRPIQCMVGVGLQACLYSGWYVAGLKPAPIVPGKREVHTEVRPELLVSLF